MKLYKFTYLITLILLVFSACPTGDVLQQVLSTTATAPVFLDCRPVSATEVSFRFSHAVRVVSLNFDPALPVRAIAEGEEVRVSFSQPLEEGKRITADVLVEDTDKNTLNVIVPFRSRNDRMPKLLFNEIRTDYSRPRVEFVEFFVLEGGNLGALRLFIAGHSITRPVYEFSPMEIGAGEYLLLNLRTLEEGNVDSNREIWVPGTTKLLRRTDALWLLDQDDRIIDALLISENPGAAWASQSINTVAELFGREKAWLPPGGGDAPDGWIPSPSDAVISAGTTATRTINRDESLAPAPSAGNWYVTATSGNTPGRPNDARRHISN